MLRGSHHILYDCSECLFHFPVSVVEWLPPVGYPFEQLTHHPHVNLLRCPGPRVEYFAPRKVLVWNVLIFLRVDSEAVILQSFKGLNIVKERIRILFIPETDEHTLLDDCADGLLLLVEVSSKLSHLQHHRQPMTNR